MIIWLALVLFVFMISFFVVGYLLKDNLFTFVSSTILLLLGLSIIWGGIGLHTSTIQALNSSTNITTINYVYTDDISLVTRGIGTVFLAFSLYMFVVSYDLYKKSKGETGLLEER